MNEVFQSTQYAISSALTRIPPSWPSSLSMVWISPVATSLPIPKLQPPPLSMGVPIDVDAVRRPKPLPLQGYY